MSTIHIDAQTLAELQHLSDAGDAVAKVALQSYRTGAAVQDYVVYVDPVTGNDANQGSIHAPWKTLDKALLSSPAQWTGKCRINLTAGSYDLPQGKVYSIGNGVGPAAEPMLISGPEAQTIELTRNITSINTNTVTVDGAALVANAWRGHFLLGQDGGGLPIYAMVVGNTTHDVQFIGSPGFDLAPVHFVKPSAKIGIGSSGSGGITTIQGRGKGVTRIELVSVSVQEQSTPTQNVDLNIKNLSLSAWNSWIGTTAANASNFGSAVVVTDAELTPAPSSLIPDLQTLLSETYNSLGAGLYVQTSSVVFNSGGSSRRGGIWLFDSTASGFTSPVTADQGSYVEMGCASFINNTVFALNGSTLNLVDPLALVKLFDQTATLGNCFQIGGRSLLLLNAMQFSNTVNPIQADNESVVILGTVGGGDMPGKGANVSGFGVSLAGMSKVVLRTNSGSTPDGSGWTAVGGASGDVNIDGLTKTWANIEGGYFANNGSAARYNTNP